MSRIVLAPRLLGLGLALLSAACASPQLSHGPLIGDVSDSRAVLWARGSGDGILGIRLQGPEGVVDRRLPLTAADDFTGKAVFDGLTPATRYQYEMSVGRRWGASETAARGHFRTAPPSRTPAPARFAFGGDVAGQNVCRDSSEGFPIFRALAATRPDFFVGLGDMIYADGVCTGTGRYGNPQVPGDFAPSSNLEAFRSHWRYAREDPGQADFLRRTPYIAVWDDHEVVNDFGPAHPGGAPEVGPLLPLGLRAFLEHNPVAPPAGSPDLLYRRLRYGRHLELFVLDTRQYRDANSMPDTDLAPKTLLGAEQRRWLLEGLTTSTATWKVVVSSVPMSIPTGSAGLAGRDGWANHEGETGFERELLAILQTLATRQVRNLLWLTTDVHFAAAFRYRPFADDPAFEVHELVTGPMNAGLFPKREFDDSLGAERLFHFGPPGPDSVKSFSEARNWFNFGLVEIGPRGELRAAILDVAGRPVFEMILDPRHATP